MKNWTFQEKPTSELPLVYHPYWMSNIGDEQPLHRMSIPGSHNAGAMYEIAPCLNPNPFNILLPGIGPASKLLCDTAGVAKYQGLTIWEQLWSGVRYLDIRVRKTPARKPGEFPYLTVWHGPNYQLQPFTSVYAAAAKFVHQFPSEAVVISIREEEGKKPLGWNPLPSDLYAEPRVVASALNNVIRFCKPLNKEMRKLAKCEGRITELKRARNELLTDKTPTKERAVRIIKKMALSKIYDKKCIVGGKPCSSFLWLGGGGEKRSASDITPVLWATKPKESLKMKHIRGKVIVTSAFQSDGSKSRFHTMFDYKKANNYEAHLDGVRIYVNDKEHKPLSNKALKTKYYKFNDDTDFRLLELNNLLPPVDGPRSRASHVNEAFFRYNEQAKAAQAKAATAKAATAKVDAPKPGLGFVAADFPGHLLIHSVFTYNWKVKQPWESFLKSKPAIVVPRRQLTYKDCGNPLMLASCVKAAKSVFVKYANKFAREEQCGGTAAECLIQSVSRPEFLMAPPPQ